MKPRKPRRWLRRRLWALLALVLLLIAAHRPLLRLTVQWAGPRIAAAYGYQLEWAVSGSMTADVAVNDLCLTGPPKGMIQRLEWRQASVEYSLRDAFTHGLTNGVQRITLTDASIEMDARKTGTPAASKPASALPEISIKGIVLQNLHARIITDKGEIVLQGFMLLLDETQSGVLEFAELSAPQSGVHLLNVRGRAQVLEQVVPLTELVVSPQLSVPRLRVNLQQWQQGSLPFELVARSGQATLVSEGRLEDLSHSPALDLRLVASQVTEADLAPWVKLPQGIAGRVDSAFVQVTGLLAEPQNLQVTVALTASDIHAANLHFKGLQTRASMDRGAMHIQSLQVQMNGRNHASFTGDMDLVSGQRIALTWNATVGDLTSLPCPAGMDLTTLPSAGRIVTQGKANGTLAELQARQLKGLKAEGTVRVTDVVWRGGHLDSAALDFTCLDNRAGINQLEIRLNDRNQLKATGHALLDGSGTFDAEVTATFDQLADFSDWMAFVKQPRITSGHASLVWKGSGKLAAHELTGAGTVKVSDLKLEGGVDVLALTLETRHAGRRAEITTFQASAGKLRAEAAMTVTETDLSIPQLVIFSGETQLVQGSAEVPLAFAQTPRLVLPLDATRPLKVHLHLAKMEVQSLYSLIAQKAPVTGLVAVDLNLNGTLSDLTGTLSATLSDVRSEAVKGNLEPALVQVDASLQQRVISLQASAQMKPLQTLTATAELPFDAAKVMAEPASLMDTPLTAHVTLSSSELAVIKRFVPAFATIKGTASADVQLSGSLRKPEWLGTLKADASRVTLKNSDMDIRDVKAHATLSGQRLTLDDVSASLSGGTARISGSADLVSLADPTLDLQLEAKQALIVRNDTMSLRADGNLTCTGTLTKADVAGRVELVRGRVFKEIEYLPLSLPNQLPAPPPVVKSRSATPSAPSFFALWNLNVDIVTGEPIRLLGNVLNGAATADLHVSGTGALPVLEGKISQLDARMRLPFSSLDLTRGDIIYTKERPFDPQIDLQGDALVDKANVTVFATGSAAKPTLRFTSSPPLSEPEIATLLATGTTAGDAQSTGGVAANRAAFLVLSKAYRKLFGKPPPKQQVADPGRFSLNLNPLSTSNAPGNFSATYEVTPQVRAEVGLGEHGVRGQVSYLMRFR